MYKRLLRPPALAALAALHAQQNTTGTTPDDDLSVLAALVVTSRAQSILQFGSFLGGSAVVLADLAAQTDTAARLVTVDPDPRMNASTRNYCDLAAIGGIVETVDGYSTDPALLARLKGQAWDLIYLDTTHQYLDTRAEIEAIAPLCGEATLFVFHDASQHAANNLDLHKQGGVARAIREWAVLHPRWQAFIFEGPAFGQFGIGLLQKKPL